MKTLKNIGYFFLKFKNNQIYKLTFEGVVFVFFAVLMVLELIENVSNIHFNYNHGVISIIMFLLATLLVFYLEFDYFKLYKQIKNFNFTMDFLIAIATHVTYLFSIVLSIIKIIQYKNIDHLGMEFYEVGYSLGFFIGIGHLIEDHLKNKSSLGIKDLLRLQNKKALVLNHKKEFIETNTNQLKNGDIVKILKGASIPTDGILINKNAYLDYSSLLGECVPRLTKKGEEILSGSIVYDEYVIYKCTKGADDSCLNKIIKQLENIIKNKSQAQIISEKIVKWFLPITILLSLITFILWMILTFNNLNLPITLPWTINLDHAALSNIKESIFNAMGVLVIACPCAFGIATPAAIYSSSFIASKNKILFANAKTYEAMNKIKYIAFDKTGTITNGKPQVIKQIGKTNLNYIVLEIARHSNHPLSLAIKNYLADCKKSIKLSKVKEIAGLGIQCRIKQDDYFLGSNKVLKNQTIEEDKSIVVFTKNNKLICYFVIDDEIKIDAKKVISKFKKQNIQTIILSGDHQSVVDKIKKQLDIDEAYANLLPNEKADMIQKYKKEGKVVFVGDGINDVLAIKAADIGIAYSSGSDITNSVADISLLANDLNLVYKSFILSKRTILLIKLNFIWAAVFNLIAVPLTMIGILPLWLGVILMTLSTIILLTNTLIFKHFNQKAISRND